MWSYFTRQSPVQPTAMIRFCYTVRLHLRLYDVAQQALHGWKYILNFNRRNHHFDCGVSFFVYLFNKYKEIKQDT